MLLHHSININSVCQKIMKNMKKKHFPALDIVKCQCQSSIYIAHHRESLYALNTLVSGKEESLQS